MWELTPVARSALLSEGARVREVDCTTRLVSRGWNALGIKRNAMQDSLQEPHMQGMLARVEWDTTQRLKMAVLILRP